MPAFFQSLSRFSGYHSHRLSDVEQLLVGKKLLVSYDQTEDNPRCWQRRAIVSAIATALAPGWASVSYAQNEDEYEDDRLEEVIVSARKRDENIQDIPQSIQAFSAAEKVMPTLLRTNT